MGNLIEKLSTLLEASAQPQATLRVVDIHDKYAHHLTYEALCVLEHNVRSTLFVRDNLAGERYIVDSRNAHHSKMDGSLARYLSVVIERPEDEAAAAKALYETVNAMAALGVLRGNLCKLSKIALRHSDEIPNLLEPHVHREPNRWVIFCFPHIDIKCQQKFPYESCESEIGATAWRE